MGKLNSNRRATQDNKMKKESRYDRKKQKVLEGELHNVFSLNTSNDWKLNLFTPSESQQPIVTSMINNYLTIADAPSGCGKTSVAVHTALSLYKQGVFKKVMFIKNPTEAGDDQIGFLSGDADDKLKAHFQETRRIFTQFISKGKLEIAERDEWIEMTIPNYLLGSTHDNAVIIIDEGQTMSPNTMKLLIERAGKDSHVVVCGDSRQRYSVKHRGDGFADLINKLTEEDEEGVRVSKYDIAGYVKLTTEDNQRSELSKLITELYE